MVPRLKMQTPHQTSVSRVLIVSFNAPSNAYLLEKVKFSSLAYFLTNPTAKLTSRGFALLVDRPQKLKDTKEENWSYLLHERQHCSY